MNLKNIFPNQLLQAPASVQRTLPRDIRAGDRVTLHPADGGAPITTTVDLAIPLFGCTTYTSETMRNGTRAMRFRFRKQDVHRLERA
ncbi:hypothetical protein V8Z80_09345 [Orrella sp. JC864]|uniref:hypothetical protein n=1 Tax=Orrella sp. JC864 TaxID=3120298 RepID=UPI0012BCACEA